MTILIKLWPCDVFFKGKGFQGTGQTPLSRDKITFPPKNKKQEKDILKQEKYIIKQEKMF